MYQDGEALEHLFDLLVCHKPAGPLRQQPGNLDRSFCCSVEAIVQLFAIGGDSGKSDA
jgi:hypothetical protein